MDRYAVTNNDGSIRFQVDDVCFMGTLDDVARDAVRRGVTDASKLHVVHAERARVAAPNVEVAVESCLEEIESDCRSSMLEEIADAIEAAQALLEEAFSKLNDRGIWFATDVVVDADEVRAAIERALDRWHYDNDNAEAARAALDG